DARADRVDLRVARLDGELRLVAGLADEVPDLDHALADLGHLELEELPDEVGVRAREDDADALALRAHLEEVRADAVADLVVLAADLLGARDDALDAPEVDDQVAALDALDRAGDDRLEAPVVLVEVLVALRLADPLVHHLAGGLGGDATELEGLQRPV